MILLPPDIEAALRANAEAYRAAQREGRAEPDPLPVLKLFNPVGAATWLATELDADGDVLFGLADLGFGCPELGTFSLSEIAAVRLPYGLRIERDTGFATLHPLSTWADWSRRAGSFSTPHPCCVASRRSRTSFRTLTMSGADDVAAVCRRPEAGPAHPQDKRDRHSIGVCVMKLDFIDHDKLFVDRTNMRYAKKAPDVADILPSVRKRGILVPLIVKPANDEGHSGIVAGFRRWTANDVVRAEGIDHGPLPCAILEDGDDAAAIEASLIENCERRDPDEVTQWESFVRLVREGRSVEDISETFGIPELGVQRILALGNLLPRVRDLYRKEQIDAATVRHLTLASKSQQRAWLALIDDPEGYAPTGRQLKAWLFGGQAISTDKALFDLADYKGRIIGDLFEKDRFFTDVEAFWTAQNATIEARRSAYLDAGWPDVVIVPSGESFQTWDHAKAPKRKGGRVYIDVRANGEVVFHEGYVTAKEARRLEKGEPIASGSKPIRAEVTSAMPTYIDLHRHAAARAALLGHPHVALRLMVAHAIAGSPLWTVKVEAQRTGNADIRESVETCSGETAFDAKRRTVLALLGFSPEEPTVTGGNDDGFGLVGVFLALLALSDHALMEVIGIVMGETLAAGSAIVEAVGEEIGVDMARYWQADDAFFEALRDKEVMVAIVAEVAGDMVARANAKETGKVLKRIVRDHLDGAGGRSKVEGWVPRWLAFPPSAYTTRGGVGSVEAVALVAAARSRGEQPDPSGPGAVEPMPEPETGADPMPLAA